MPGLMHLLRPAIDPRIDPSIDPSIDPWIDPGIDPAIDPAIDPMFDPRIGSRIGGGDRCRIDEQTEISVYLISPDSSAILSFTRPSL